MIDKPLPVLSAADRVVMRIALDGTGFVSESELNPSQIGTARDLFRRGLLKNAGKEPDGTKVYRPGPSGMRAFGRSDE